MFFRLIFPIWTADLNDVFSLKQVENIFLNFFEKTDKLNRQLKIQEHANIDLLLDTSENVQPFKMDPVDKYDEILVKKIILKIF